MPAALEELHIRDTNTHVCIECRNYELLVEERWGWLEGWTPPFFSGQMRLLTLFIGLQSFISLILTQVTGLEIGLR